MMASNRCENALKCYKDKYGEWWCDCYLLGDAQAIGLQCGKGVCELYRIDAESQRQLEMARMMKGKAHGKSRAIAEEGDEDGK